MKTMRPRDHLRRDPNYLCLMIGLVTAVILATAAAPLGPAAILGGFIAVVTLLAAAYRLIERRHHLICAVALGVTTFAPLTWYSFHQDLLGSQVAGIIYLVNISLWVLFVSHITYLVFCGIIRARRIGPNEIYGAVYVYILIGTVFAALFQLVLAWQPDALFFDPDRFQEPQLVIGNLRTRGAGAVLYYSFVTLATIGYGDVTPASPLARSLSLIEAIIGIMYIATMIARFVSNQMSAEEHDR